MNNNDKSNKFKSENKASLQCDTCAYYDVIDENGELGCVVDIDEDELYDERQNPKRQCRYYKFYDEYKSVQKQN